MPRRINIVKVTIQLWDAIIVKLSMSTFIFKKFFLDSFFYVLPSLSL